MDERWKFAAELLAVACLEMARHGEYPELETITEEPEQQFYVFPGPGWEHAFSEVRTGTVLSDKED